MAASVVQSNSGVQNTGLATVSATLFAAATAGSVIVLHVAADDYAATPPTGFTLSTGCKQETFLGHYLWWKVAAGGETSVSYTIGSASPSCWIIEEISGLTGTPYDISNGQLTATAGTNYTTPTITPTAGDRFLVGSIGGSLGSAGLTSMASWLSSFIEIADAWTTLATGTRDSQGAATRGVTADGVTGYSTGATWDAGGTAQARTGIIIAFKVAAGGGTSFTATQTDNAGLTDTTATASAFARTQNDPAGLTDTVSAVLNPGGTAYTRQVDDPAGLTDSTSVVSAFAITVDDPAGITDTGSPMRIDIVDAVTDPAGLTDSTTTAVAYTRVVDDQLGLVDTTSSALAGAGTRQVDDPVGLTDSVVQATVSARTVVDLAGLTDLVAAAAVYTRAVADVLGLTDSTTVGAGVPGRLTPTTTAGRLGSATASGRLNSSTSGGQA